MGNQGLCYTEARANRVRTVGTDINDLLVRIQEERNHSEVVPIKSSQDTFVKAIIYEPIENKNYSDYMKLISSLGGLLNTYQKLLQSYSINETDFFIDLIEALDIESKDCHALMSDALDRSNNDQYRCLAQVYSNLIYMIDDINKSISHNFKTNADFSNKEDNSALVGLHSHQETQKCTKCNNNKHERLFYKPIYGKQIMWCKDCI